MTHRHTTTAKQRAADRDRTKRKQATRRQVHALLQEAHMAHVEGLPDEARAQRYDALMARFQEIEEGRG